MGDYRRKMVCDWCFTAFKIEDFNPQNFVDYGHFLYLGYQKEKCPDTGRLHLQGFAQFSRSVRGSKVQELANDETLHIEPARDAKAARSYCILPSYKGKDKIVIDGPYEFGEFKERKPGERTDLSDFTAAIDEGLPDWKLKEMFPNQMFKYQHMVSRYRTIQEPKVRDPPKVIVITGETGIGKTRTVYDSHSPGDIFKMEPNYLWFDGYTGQKIVLFDEYECQFKLTFLLQILDRYPVRVPIKGGFVDWVPEIIYITANISFTDWYLRSPQSQVSALRRRVTEIREMEDPVTQYQPMEYPVEPYSE